MRLSILSALVLSGALFAAGGVQAGTIYNGGTPSDPDSFYYGDSTYYYSKAADTFALTAGGTTIGGVNWWGGCASGSFSPTSCPTGNFKLFIYSDASGSPGAQLHEYNVGGANQAFVTTGVNGYSEYSYSASIPALTLTAGTQYWLGIQDQTTSDFVWGWDTTSNAPDGLENEASFGAGSWTPFNADLAFNLTSASTSAVPEPFTLSLFGAGVVGAAALRRRKKKA